MLKAARDGAVEGSWLVKIFACLDGNRIADARVAAADSKDPEHVCQGYYYAGEASLLDGRTDKARDWFQKCVDTNLAFDQDMFPPDPMNEYHLARWRLEQLTAEDAPIAQPKRG